MKWACFVLVWSVVCISSSVGQRIGEGDVSRVLGNRDYVNRQVNCVLEKGGCDSVGRQLKLAIPEVLGRGCRECTPKQIDNSRKVVNFLRTNYPGAWTQIEGKYGRALI